MPLRFARATGIVSTLCGTAAASACLVCDPEVVITKALASCFLEISAASLADMDRNNLEYQLINLGNCEEISGEVRGGDETADSLRQIVSLADIRNARDDTRAEASTTFILDRAGILCLQATIHADPSVFDPAAAFRPAEMCDP